MIHETGDPGRGSSKHLYMAEARRRLDTGDVPDGITDFSKQLANWLKCTHPLAAQPTPRTIENRIRPLCAATASAQNNRPFAILCVFFVRPIRAPSLTLLADDRQ